MKHLTAQQVNQQLDGALPPEERDDVLHHLEECAICRQLVQEFVVQGEQISHALRHDPGEAYFATFSGRVMERVAAERAAAHPGRAAGARGGWLGWVGSPRALATVGGTLAILAVAGIAFVQWRSRPSAFAILGHAKGKTAEAPHAERGRTVDEGSRAQSRATEREGAVSKDSKEAEAPAERAVDRRANIMSSPGAREVAESNLRQAPAPPAATRARDVGVDDRAGAAAGRAEPTQTKAQKLEEASGTQFRFAKPSAAPPVQNEAVPRPGEAQGGTNALRKDVAARSLGSAEKSRAPAPSAAAPMSATLDARSPLVATTVRVCGVVRDPNGRAVPGALVAVAESGRSTVSEADGAFCIDAPGGRSTLAALAVGFETARIPLADATSAEPIAVVLKPVATVVPPSPFAGGAKRVSGAEADGANAPDPFEGEAAATRAEVARARQQAGLAARERSAGAWDAAATDWARVLARVAGVGSADEARYRVAEARFRAWEAAPDARRARLAEETLTSFLVRAPLGAKRDQASRWAQQLSR